jgi:hypothetical protein
LLSFVINHVEDAVVVVDVVAVVDAVVEDKVDVMLTVDVNLKQSIQMIHFFTISPLTSI